MKPVPENNNPQTGVSAIYWQQMTPRVFQGWPVEHPPTIVAIISIQRQLRRFVRDPTVLATTHNEPKGFPVGATTLISIHGLLN